MLMVRFEVKSSVCREDVVVAAFERLESGLLLGRALALDMDRPGCFTAGLFFEGVVSWGAFAMEMAFVELSRVLEADTESLDVRWVDIDPPDEDEGGGVPLRAHTPDARLVTRATPRRRRAGRRFVALASGLLDLEGGWFERGEVRVALTEGELRAMQLLVEAAPECVPFHRLGDGAGSGVGMVRCLQLKLEVDPKRPNTILEEAAGVRVELDLWGPSQPDVAWREHDGRRPSWYLHEPDVRQTPDLSQIWGRPLVGWGCTDTSGAYPEA